MKEIECVTELQNTVRQIFEDTKIIKIIDMETYPGDDSSPQQKIQADFTVSVRAKGKKEYTLLFEVKSIGQPRYVRMAANQLQTLVSGGRNTYGVFGAPYLSEESIKICRQAGIGCIDVAGNCLLEFDNVYISIQGRPNPYPAKRALKSLFAPKSTRALRVFLCNSRREWTLKELAKEANISLGLASNIKKKLLDYEFIEEVTTKRGLRFRTLNPETLLQKWAENYAYRKNKLKSYYSFDQPKEIEQNLADYCKANRIRYAFTLTSGAALVAPSLRYARVFAYIQDSLESIVQALNWKEVSSGQNVSILEPYDEGIFYGVQDINGIKVVSDIQLYLDLQSYRGRGEEAAQFLLETHLRAQW